MHVHYPKPTHAISLFSFFFFCAERRRRCGFSAGVHAEQLDAVRAPVEADSRVEDQGPDVGDEEVFRLVLLHILKLELWKLLLTQGK